MNIVKNIVTPVEVEAENLGEALIPEIDTDHGKVVYIVDACPSDSLMNWAKY